VETEDLKDDDLMRRKVREVASDILDKWDF